MEIIVQIPEMGTLMEGTVLDERINVGLDAVLVPALHLGKVEQHHRAVASH